MLFTLLFAYYASRVRVFRDLRTGRTTIARWTVPVDEFAAFRAQEAGIGGGSVGVSFYRLPAVVPDDGIEVILFDRGVLIDGGWFPLSFTGGRRVLAADYQIDPRAIAFTTRLTTSVRTSSVTVATRHAVSILCVPVARAARAQAGVVVDRCLAQLATHWNGLPRTARDPFRPGIDRADYRSDGWRSTCTVVP